MAITVSALTGVLTLRCGGTLSAANLDAVAAALYAESIASACRDCGVTLANPLSPADPDLAGVDQNTAAKLADVAEWRALESALGNMGSPDQKVSMGEWDWGKLRDSIERTVARKAAQVRKQWGVGLGTLTGSYVNLHISTPTWPCGTGTDGNGVCP